MGKNWDYSELSHVAKLNGGPEKYISLIKEHSRSAGRLEGRTEGKIELLVAEGVVAGIGLLGLAGYKAYSTIKEKHEKERLEKESSEVKKAEEILLNKMTEEIKKQDGENSESKLSNNGEDGGDKNE